MCHARPVSACGLVGVVFAPVRAPAPTRPSCGPAPTTGPHVQHLRHQEGRVRQGAGQQGCAPPRRQPRCAPRGRHQSRRRRRRAGCCTRRRACTHTLRCAPGTTAPAGDNVWVKVVSKTGQRMGLAMCDVDQVTGGCWRAGGAFFLPGAVGHSGALLKRWRPPAALPQPPEGPAHCPAPPPRPRRPGHASDAGGRRVQPAGGRGRHRRQPDRAARPVGHQGAARGGQEGATAAVAACWLSRAGMGALLHSLSPSSLPPCFHPANALGPPPLPAPSPPPLCRWWRRTSWAPSPSGVAR